MQSELKPNVHLRRGSLTEPLQTWNLKLCAQMCVNVIMGACLFTIAFSVQFNYFWTTVNHFWLSFKIHFLMTWLTVNSVNSPKCVPQSLMCWNMSVKSGGKKEKKKKKKRSFGYETAWWWSFYMTYIIKTISEDNDCLVILLVLMPGTRSSQNSE